MQTAIALITVVFIFLCGRNDGGPLLALSNQTERRWEWVPTIFLFSSLPIVAALGFSQVAKSLEELLEPALDEGKWSVPVLVALLAVLVTLGISTFLNAPTSITLALIGSLAGVSLGAGGEVPWEDLSRVVVLGLAAPLVAGLLAFLLTRIRLGTLPGSPRVRPIRRWSQRIAYFLLLGAYATNDGQKVLFAVALALGLSVGEVADMAVWVLLAAFIFAFGAVAGAYNSGQFIRHGISRPRAGGIFVTELSAAVAVFGGSLLGTPLSMTQSIAGGLAGTGLAHSSRALYWQGLRKVGFTWIWTLPLSGIVAYLLALVGEVIFR